MAVFGVDVVGILRFAAIAREEVAFPELVVLEPAVGVVDASAPPVADALLELEDRGVVLALASGVLAHQDVAELRERTQQLTALDRWRWSTLEPWPAGKPKNGFGTFSLQRSAPSARLE